MFLKPKELILTEDDENQILKKFYNLNPFPNKSIPKDFYVKGEGKLTQYNIFSWLSGKNEDQWISHSKIKYELAEIGLTIQLYYDIVVTNINDISLRPICKNCGKYTRFKNFSRGYFEMCDLSCTSTYGNKLPSKREAVSKGLTGKHLSIEHKKACSEAAIKRRNEENNISGYKNTKRGVIASIKAGKELSFLSSWEERFIKYIDNCDYIISISSVDFSIPYKINDEFHNYLPDFLLTTIDNKKIVVEIKPYRNICRLNNNYKIKAGLDYCNKNNYIYIVLTEYDLFLKQNPVYEDIILDLKDYIEKGIYINRMNDIISKIGNL